MRYGHTKLFKIGDRVIVSNPQACVHGCNDLMKKLEGEEAIVVDVGDMAYYIDIDGQSWMWCDESLTAIEEAISIPNVDVNLLL